MEGGNSARASTVVVLVRARNALNIGAAARAMQDFGFADLRVVNDYAVSFEDARSAVDAAPVLLAARQCTTVADAVADCTLVLGTTALGDRRLVHPVKTLRAAAADARAGASAGGRTALLFGSEKTGLSNEEMSHCHALLTIPMHAAGVSMNLGQAVAVCLYELARESQPPRALPEPAMPATAADLHRFETLLRGALLAAGYDRRFPGNMGDETLRRLVHRLAPPAADMEVWFGMLKQLLWRMRHDSSV